jgi:multimeric flavodoxin WrbA
MKFFAISSSPRRQKNTGQLLAEMVNSAQSSGAEAELMRSFFMHEHKTVRRLFEI